MSEKLTVHECYPGVFRAYYDPEGHTGEGKNREEAIIDLMEQEIDSYETRLATVAGQRDYLMKDQKVKDDMLKQLKVIAKTVLDAIEADSADCVLVISERGERRYMTVQAAVRSLENILGPIA